jgi:hypothetical protein
MTQQPQTANTIFQCVMAKVEETPELMSLNSTFRNVFPREEGPYWPHLSLVYGDLGEDVRSRVQTEIKENKSWDIVGSDVLVDCIEIWDTSGETHTWSKVGDVQLQP